MMNARTRRRRAVIACLAVSLVSAAAACGDDDTAATTPDSAPGSAGSAASVDSDQVPTDADPDGVLRVGTTLDIIGGTTFDPTLSQIISSEEWMTQVYGTLLHRQEDGTYEPWMAKSVETVDPRTVSVTLRKGTVFSDGTPYDADAVKAGMLRTMDESTDAAAAGQNSLFRAVDEITVESPTKLTFHLTKPFAGDFYQVLAGRESMIVSPATDPAKLDEQPVGAGPFLLTEYKEMQHLTMEKNPKYWNASEVHLAGLEFIHTPAGAPRANALLSETVDIITEPAPADLPQFESDPYASTSIIEDAGYIVLNPCTTKPPLDDPDIRHALQIGFDREAMNELFLGGLGDVAQGLWPSDNPKYDAGVEQYTAYDPEAAKLIVDEAGLTGTTIDVYYPNNLGYEQLAEVIRSQADSIGLTLNMVPSSDVVAEFIEPQKPGLLLIPGSRTGTDKYLRIFADNQVQNLCTASRPEMVEIINPIGAVAPDSQESIELNHAVELEIAENAWVIPLIYSPTSFAWSTDRIGGEMTFGGQKLLYDVADLYIRQ